MLNKKIVLLFMASFFLLFMSNLLFAQSVKRVLNPYVIDFADADNLSATTLPETFDGHSDGEFTSDGVLKFYKSGPQIFNYNGTGLNSFGTGYLNNEVEIVQKPGSSTNYYIIYGEILPVEVKVYYAEIEVIGENINQIGNEIWLFDAGGMNLIGMAVSKKEMFNNQMLYINGPNEIHQYEITSTGLIDNGIFSTGQTYGYGVSELEMSYDGTKLFFGDNTTWSNKLHIVSLNASGLCESISSTSFGDYFYVEGLEPSPADNTKLYLAISGSNPGVYEYDINSHNLTKLNSGNSTIKTHLKIINGYIWGINQNDNLFRINPYTGEFIDDFVTGYNFTNTGFNSYVFPDKEIDYVVNVTATTEANCAQLGSVTVIAYLATPPYNFNFNNGQYEFTGSYGENTFTGIAPDTYDIEITDTDNNSVTIEDVIVEEDFHANLDYTTPSNCYEKGTVTIEAVLMTEPFDFDFNNGQYLFTGNCGTNKFFEIDDGVYDVLVTDADDNSILIEDVVVEKNSVAYFVRFHKVVVDNLFLY